jgi:hypothetical protein
MTDTLKALSRRASGSILALGFIAYLAFVSHVAVGWP